MDCFYILLLEKCESLSQIAEVLKKSKARQINRKISIDIKKKSLFNLVYEVDKVKIEDIFKKEEKI